MRSKQPQQRSLRLEVDLLLWDAAAMEVSEIKLPLAQWQHLVEMGEL